VDVIEHATNAKTIYGKKRPFEVLPKRNDTASAVSIWVAKLEEQMDKLIEQLGELALLSASKDPKPETTLAAFDDREPRNSRPLVRWSNDKPKYSRSNSRDYRTTSTNNS